MLQRWKAKKQHIVLGSIMLYQKNSFVFSWFWVRNALSESICHCWRPFPCFPFCYLVLFFFSNCLNFPSTISFPGFPPSSTSFFFLWAFKVRASLQSPHRHFKYKSLQGQVWVGSEQGEAEKAARLQTKEKMS